MFKQIAQAAVVASVALTGLAATPAFAHDRYERGDYYNDGYRGDNDDRYENQQEVA